MIFLDLHPLSTSTLQRTFLHAYLNGVMLGDFTTVDFKAT